MGEAVASTVVGRLTDYQTNAFVALERGEQVRWLDLVGVDTMIPVEGVAPEQRRCSLLCSGLVAFEGLKQIGSTNAYMLCLGS